MKVGGSENTVLSLLYNSRSFNNERSGEIRTTHWLITPKDELRFCGDRITVYRSTKSARILINPWTIDATVHRNGCISGSPCKSDCFTLSNKCTIGRKGESWVRRWRSC